ncbi:hypothetical protein CfE428DRAFT_0808 [Chthoniobacter flavus Ellin428]|uniref:GYF domain-containing protein n=1 Tax=Chthoniobacter flavus Ellin428 TaxID=497964 RepID=B4CVX1_9BACT|nr:DUF4339 domain-containing protein [Chthoniobacter flavus]EDY21563.1 hypothetical protein CfE428DRAFT_0808 [Chthoniobacter flavus Ellin428]TCO95506.1 uncharacterized protein DUF4339 [Chthoniobacter flavus]
MNWYYVNGKDRLGPVDDAELQRLSQQNVVRGDTLVWRDGMAGWQPHRDVAVATIPTAAGSVVCAACGRTVSDAESFTLSGLTYCAGCKPQVMQRVIEGQALPAGDAEELRKAHIKHEASVKSIGLLYYIGGVALALLGLTQILTVLSGKGQPTGLVLGVVFIIMSVLEFIGGTGIRRLRPWSRVVVGIVSGLGLLGFPVGTLINAYILYLVFSKKGAMLFTPEYHAAIAKTPHVRYRTSIIVWILLGFILLLIVIGLTAVLFSKH